MKWPFVRRSKYENAMIYGINTAKEITEKTSYIHKLENEINRLNQENQKLMEDIYNIGNDLAKELNSHRETKEHEQKLFKANDKLNQQNMGLLFELEETKDALKIAQEDLEKESKNHLKTYAIFKDTKRKIYNILKESL